MDDFQYERFLALSGSEFCAYMDPFVNNPKKAISQEVLNRMVEELSIYDDYHLVYTFLIAESRSPKVFSRFIPQYLAHESLSVRIAAYNFLNHLPDELITSDLIESVRRALGNYPRDIFPKVEEFSVIVENLKKRQVEILAIGAE